MYISRFEAEVRNKKLTTYVHCPMYNFSPFRQENNFLQIFIEGLWRKETNFIKNGTGKGKRKIKEIKVHIYKSIVDQF